MQYSRLTGELEMIERLGCEMEQVWLTLALASMPLMLILAIPEECRWFLVFSAIASILVPFAPYTIAVKETGLKISSVFRTVEISWSDVLNVRYNNPCRLMIIRTDKHYAVIPFGIWIHTRASDGYFMLLDYVNRNVSAHKVKSSKLI